VGLTGGMGAAPKVVVGLLYVEASVMSHATGLKLGPKLKTV
jgi:hypothetical protein